MGFDPKEQKQEGLKAILELHKEKEYVLEEEHEGGLKVGFLDKD